MKKKSLEKLVIPKSYSISQEAIISTENYGTWQAWEALHCSSRPYHPL